MQGLKWKSFFSDCGGWNVSKLRSCLSAEAWNLIVNKYIPLRNRGDCVLWRHANDGKFSVRSAYGAISGNMFLSEERIWKVIWKWPGMQRIRYFLWLLGKNKLFTNSQRVQRNCGRSASCSRCGAAVESSLHAVRDCGAVKAIWKKLVHPSFWEEFFSLDLKSWLLCNLTHEWVNLGKVIGI